MNISRPVILIAALISSQALAETSLNGTGSVLAGPLCLKWIQEWRKVEPGVKVQYEVKDSSEGVQKALDHGKDFAFVDTPFTLDEGRLTQSRAILHLPVALEAVAITYNLPGIETGLQLSPAVLSDIFQGVLKKWNASAIQELNPGVDLPDVEIRVVHREEASSLHDLFPAFLAKIDPKWVLKHEKDRKLHWPAGQNVKGDDKVLEKLRLWPGTVAAVDLSFAAQNHLPTAALKNQAGHFVAPTTDSLQAALSDLQGLPDDFEVNLDQSRAKEAYPLTAFSYLLVHQNYFDLNHDPKKSQALVDFLNWILTDGQKWEKDLSYAPLPESFLSQVKDKVGTIKH